MSPTAVNYCMGPGFHSDLKPAPCPHGRGKIQCEGRRLCCDGCAQEHKRLTSNEYYKQQQKDQRRRKGEEPAAVPAKATMPDTSRWMCRKCGCTERVACFGGCCWVAKEVCSACATPAQLIEYELARLEGHLAEILSLPPGQWKPKPAAKKKPTLSGNGVRMGRPPKKKNYPRRRKRPAWSR